MFEKYYETVMGLIGFAVVIVFAAWLLGFVTLDQIRAALLLN